MPSFQSLTPDQLSRLIGTPHCPPIIDVRTPEDFAGDPRLIPGSQRRDSRDIAWIETLKAEKAIVVCQAGHKLSHGIAALLRHRGMAADVLEEGFAGWTSRGLPAVPSAVLAPRDAEGRTVWVTRWRPKIDRIACAWLIRRFVDRHAVFLFVAPAEVLAVAERFNATPFDTEGDGRFGHRDDRCSFDAMLTAFGLETDPLLHLATLVRGGDTGRPELAPEVAGLVAVSLGLSRLHAEDLPQVEAGLVVYDALYRWCRDATAEQHQSPTSSAGA